MEAMLSGVPVAASEVGGIPSLVKDGITGILVKPEDSDGLALAIIDLLKNKEKGRGHGCGRERIDHQGIFSGKDG